MFFLPIEASKTAGCAMVIAKDGSVDITASGYETGEQSHLLIFAGRIRIDLLPMSGISSIVCGEAVRFDIIKGTALVHCGKEKAGIKSGNITIETANSVFSISKSQINVLSGFVTVKVRKKNIRAGIGMSLDLKSGKISNTAEPESLAMDKFNILCTVNLEPKDYINARNAFAGAFNAFYHAGSTYFSFDNPKEDYDLKFDLKMEKKDSRYLFNGMIKNPLTDETVAIIHEDEPADETGILSGFSKAGMKAGRAIQFYGSRVLTEGTKVFIEVDGYNTENANEIKEILEKTPGINGLKYTDFDGKKAVFEMQFMGNGYDLAEIIRGIKIKNKSINIWKISKFVVKLTIV